MQEKKTKKTCDKCSKKSVIKLTYGPHFFCENHFNKFFENRFKKTIRKHCLIKPKEKLLVALSGGKDSIVTLILLHKFFSKSNIIKALIIDEGVQGYRNKAIRIAEQHCKKLGVEYNVVSFKEKFGITNDEIMPLIMANKKLNSTCSFCGSMRRNLMNSLAKQFKADKLVTGHNLDDEVQSFVMNVFNNELERVMRSGAKPGLINHACFVKRIKPLYETPEKEIVFYCKINNIKHYSQKCCPYSWTAKRNDYRKMLNQFDERFPGTMYSILRFNEALKQKILPSESEKKVLRAQLKNCSNCNTPTEKVLCNTCELLLRLKNEKQKEIIVKKETQKNEKKNHKIKK